MYRILSLDLGGLSIEKSKSSLSFVQEDRFQYSWQMSTIYTHKQKTECRIAIRCAI